MHLGGSHASGSGPLDAPRVHAAWNVVGVSALVLAIAFLGWLAGLNHQISKGAPEPTTLFDHPAEELHDLYHQSDWVQYGFLLFAFVAGGCYFIPRRHRPGVWIPIAAGVAAACVALAVGTYVPCAPEGNPVIPVLGWVIGTFEGDIEIAGPGARCALAFSPGFELARGLAVLFVAFALSVVLFKFARKAVDKWRATSASDVDLVVGLDDTTLPLIRALARERDLRSGYDDWIDERPGMVQKPVRKDGRRKRLLRHEVDVSWIAFRLWQWTGIRRGDVRRRLQRRTCIAVIDMDDSGAHGYELRQLGVKVLSVDPTKRGGLEPLLINWRLMLTNRTVVRRLFAVTADQQINLQVFEAAKQVLHGQDLEPHVLGLIPRLFVRIEDEREARQWRIENLPGADGRYVADVITPEGIAARTIAERAMPPWELIPSEIEHVLVIGEGSLWLALLDELAWQQWTRYEFAIRKRPDIADAVARPALRTVTLLGSNARKRVIEWRQLRAPWVLPAAQTGDGPSLEMFRVDDPSSWDSHEKDWEAVADELLGEGATMAVFVDHSAAYLQAATRLAMRHPPIGRAPSILIRSDRSTRWKTPVTQAGLQRFALSLVTFDRWGKEAPPPDSVGRLAEQQHTLFRGQWPVEPTARPDDEVEDKEIRRAFKDRFRPVVGRKVTGDAWDDLPEFIREDNIRQHWEILNWFAAEGGWRRVVADEADERPPNASISPELLESIARAESQRWNDVRLRSGWWRSTNPDLRWDTSRVSPMITKWADKPDRVYDMNLVRQILDRFWAMGLEPVLDQSLPKPDRKDTSTAGQTDSKPPSA